MKPLERYPLAIVRWVDSAYTRGESATGDLPTEGLEMISAGFLVRETPDAITLALDRHLHDDAWRFVLTIPRVSVRNVKKVRR